MLLQTTCRSLCLLAACCLIPAQLHAQSPFLTQSQWVSLRDASSGTAPYENLRALTRLHRVPATPEFDQAADFILARANEYGLHDPHAEQFPIDGKLHYGLMRSHLAWTVKAGSLWELGPQNTLIGDWATDPIRLADYSHTADVTTTLIDVGSGTADVDYAGKDLRGKIVLADGVLAVAQHLAVVKYGAAGIVSDMPNQSTAWSGLDPTIVRWGHLDATVPTGFAFMVSHETAAALREQLRHDHPIELHAHVDAEVTPGHWTVVTATIPGTDPNAGEVVYSCHLDHQRPGANDNASGCVTILESARVLNHLIESGALARPTRTLRFIWGPEIEGTMAFLSKHPDLRHHMQADIHMDMVGGDPFKNKSILHVTETPWSLPTFITDIGDLFAETIRTAATNYAEDGSHGNAALLEDRNGAPGTRNALFADETAYTEGSDHDVYDSSTIAVPSLYLRDWPDIYIHTDHDTLNQLDATKLRRVAMLGAAAGYTYASLGGAQSAAALPFFASRSMQRLAQASEHALILVEDPSVKPEEAWYEARNLLTQLLHREEAELQSFAACTKTDPVNLAPFYQILETLTAALNASIDQAASRRGAATYPASPPWHSDADATVIPTRIGDIGPLTYQNDNVLLDRLGQARVDKIKLLSGSSRLLHLQDRGALSSYEILNFVNGKRTIGEIRDAVSAEYSPIPIEVVADFLKACEEAKIVSFH